MLLNITAFMEIINERCCKLTCSLDAQCAAYMYEEKSMMCLVSSQVKLLQLTPDAVTYDRISKVFVKNAVRTVTLTQTTGKYLDAKSFVSLPIFIRQKGTPSVNINQRSAEASRMRKS